MLSRRRSFRGEGGRNKIHNIGDRNSQFIFKK